MEPVKRLPMGRHQVCCSGRRWWPGTRAAGPLADAFCSFACFCRTVFSFPRGKQIPVSSKIPTLNHSIPLPFYLPRDPELRGLFGCTKRFFYGGEPLVLVSCDAIQHSAVLVSTPFVFHCQQVLRCILHCIFLSVTKDFCAGRGWE